MLLLALLCIECTDILWKHVQRFGYPPEVAQQDVADLIQLPPRIVSTADLAYAALALAVVHEITACDAAYVALAQRLSLPLVTANERLFRRLEGIDLDVHWLGRWPA